MHNQQTVCGKAFAGQGLGVLLDLGFENLKHDLRLAAMKLNDPPKDFLPAVHWIGCNDPADLGTEARKELRFIKLTDLEVMLGPLHRQNRGGLVPGAKQHIRLVPGGWV